MGWLAPAVWLAQALTLAQAAAEASPRTVVVGVASAAPAPSRAAIEREVVRGLGDPGLRVVRADRALLDACDTPGCFKMVAAKYEAAFLVRATVEVALAAGKNAAKQADYTLRVEGLDATTGEAAVTPQEASCPQCRPSEAEETAYLLAAQLRRSLMLLPQPQPSAPTVRPPDLALRDPRRQPDVVVPAPAAARGKTASAWKTPVGIGALIAGAGAVALGGYYVSLDGKCEDGACTRLYSSATLGWTVVGLGGAALVAGAVLLIPWPSSRDTTVAVGPASISLRGFF